VTYVVGLFCGLVDTQVTFQQERHRDRVSALSRSHQRCVAVLYMIREIYMRIRTNAQTHNHNHKPVTLLLPCCICTSVSWGERLRALQRHGLSNLHAVSMEELSEAEVQTRRLMCVGVHV